MNKNMNFNIPIYFTEEGNLIIAHSPALDLTTQGENLNEARKNFDELLEIFIEENQNQEQLEKVLMECGWQKTPTSMLPPQTIAQITQKIVFPSFSYATN